MSSTTIEIQETSVITPSSPISEMLETSEITPSSPIIETREASGIAPPSLISETQETSGIIPRQTLRDHTNGLQIGDDWRDQEDGVGVITMALSPRGDIVASGSGDGTVRLWNAETVKVIAKRVGHTRSVWSVGWSPAGERVVSGSEDGTARVWDVETSETTMFCPIKTAHRFVYAVSYSPDSKHIATGGYKKNEVQIWDADTRKLLSTIEHSRPVYCMTWTSDGKKFISGSDVGSIRILNSTQSNATRSPFSNVITTLVRLWNLDTYLPVGEPLRHEAGVYCAALSTNGKLLVTGCNDYNAYVWDIHAILKEIGLDDLLSNPPKDESKDVADKSFLEADATGQLEDGYEPQSFFDGTQWRVHYLATRHAHTQPSARRRSSILASLGSRPLAALNRLSSLFQHAPPIDYDATQLQQRSRQGSSHRPPVVEVAAVQDKRTLYVAPPRNKKSKIEVTQTQGQQSVQNQPVASSSRHDTTAAGEMSATPITAADSATTPVVAKLTRWWIHIVLFACCTSVDRAAGHR
ncbi:WD40 repeat-like protein [Suillus weaverae]|nr:WD40 repeat-like protein [Suillus weaverae]